jgi:oxygen-independent coproporphyrinogen III oxidase
MTAMPAPHRQAPAPLSDTAVLARLDERLPRYTSYPTAPHFTSQVGPDTYIAWLDSLDAQLPVSLYLHIPFCETLCSYCAATPRSATGPTASHTTRSSCCVR